MRKKDTFLIAEDCPDEWMAGSGKKKNHRSARGGGDASKPGAEIKLGKRGGVK